MTKKEKILIVRLSAIGDVIHTLPVAYSIKKQNPDVFIGWAVEDKAADIIKNNPLVDKAHVMPRQTWKKRGFSIKNFFEFISFIHEIKKENYTISLDVQELFKSAIISFLSGAKKRIAHAKAREFAHFFATHKIPARDLFDINIPVIQRNLDFAKFLDINTEEVNFALPPVDDKTKTYVNELLAAIDPQKPTLVFSPATLWKTKHWIEEYWSILLDELSNANNIIFSGTKSDLPLIERIIKQSNAQNYTVIAGKTDLFQLVEVFNRSDIVIGPDTGPIHIANATNKPEIICIFGSTAAKRSGPYGEKHVSLSMGLNCQPCFDRNCTNTSNLACVKQITPDMILDIVNEKIAYIKRKTIV